MKDINNEVIKNIREIGQYMMSQAQCGYAHNRVSFEERAKIANCIELLDEACELMEEYSRVLDEQNRKLDVILEKLGDKA